MQQLKLILILVTCFVFKATMVAGAEMETSGKQAEQAVSEETKTIAEPVSEATRSATSPTYAAPVQNNNVHVSLEGGDTRVSHNNEVGSVLGTKTQESNQSLHTAITPMIGLGNFYGAWGNHVSNTYSLGLGLEVAMNSLISFEVEGGYAKYNVGYNYYRHDFNQYNIGANTKLYMSRSMIQPWIGLGAMGLYYDNMSHGPTYPYSNYSQWMGAIQPIAGLDVEVAKGFAVGVRGAYVIPVINKPKTMDNGVYSYPTFEEAGLMNTSFYKVMADVKVMF